MNRTENNFSLLSENISSTVYTFEMAFSVILVVLLKFVFGSAVMWWLGWRDVKVNV